MRRIDPGFPRFFRQLFGTWKGTAIVKDDHRSARRTIGIPVALIALLCIGGAWFASDEDLEKFLESFLLNLGTEAISVFATVVIIEYILEMVRIKAEEKARKDKENAEEKARKDKENARLDEEIRRLSWDLLRRMHHAVFVWLGGTSRFDYDRMAARLAAAKPKMPMTPMPIMHADTLRLFRNVCEGADILRFQREDLTGRDERFKKALDALHEAPRNTAVSEEATKDVYNHINEARRALAEIVRGPKLVESAFVGAVQLEKVSEKDQVKRATR